MSHRYYPPAYLRYLKARLFIFRQPAFWGISMFLLLVGIISWEYWLKPDNLSEKPNSEAISEEIVIESDSTMSAEDKSIAADIDNLPVLLNDFNQADALVNNIQLPISNQTQENRKFLEEVIKQNNADIQSPSINNSGNNLTPPMEKNSFVTQAENLLYSSGNNFDNQFLGTNSLTTLPETTSTTTSFNHQTSQTANSVLVNPLATAIQQSNNYSNRINTSIPINNSLSGQVVSPSNRVGYIQPTFTNQQLNVYPNINSIQTSQPGELPTSGVSYPIQSTNPVVVNPATPLENGNYSGYGIQPPLQTTPSDLSSPAPIQGQYPSGYGN
ncbi:hypothetical protein FJR38_09080 [Anabaena sp. UHCC 0253]|uniref:hypothetical protein n=1 Tax=Anabaena sp. UHCC 0253 TaxID=2590019 RepID=UPI001445F031|nr:hypothetical protein [Anabaena sp. UHCC 0253]MTJ52803.1 hypothetical protein [Anabaena sp. UHCC 0253]